MSSTAETSYSNPAGASTSTEQTGVDEGGELFLNR